MYFFMSYTKEPNSVFNKQIVWFFFGVPKTVAEVRGGLGLHSMKSEFR